MEDKLYDEWVPLSKREKLSYGRIFAIACCNLIQGLSYNIINITVKPFLSELGFKGIAENMMLLIGSVVGFFMVPLLGVFSDGLMLKFGRRRIFVIIGTFLIVFGILNCFCVIGQQLTNWGFGLLVDHVYPNDPFAVRKKISYSSSFGFLATIASFWIIQPTLAETGQYQQIPDESGAAVEYAE